MEASHPALHYWAVASRAEVAVVQVAEGGVGTGASPSRLCGAQTRVQHLELSGKECAGGRRVG